VYKYGVKFSRRTIDEVKKDIERAKKIDDYIMENLISGITSIGEGYSELEKIIKELKNVGKEDNDNEQNTIDNYGDERIKWFSQWFKDKPDLEDSLNHVYTWRMAGGETCFFGDANTLLVKPDFFAQVMEYVNMHFPTLKRFTVYGRTNTAAHMDIEDLRSFGKAGLNRIHFGIESGSNRVLSFMKKGVTAEEHIEGCLKTREAGISPSVYIMPGLGGNNWSHEHAYETAHVLTKAMPDYIRIRTLEIFAGTPLMRAKEAGEFIEAEEEQVVKEIKIIVENTEAETTIISDSASNLLDVHGRLPWDRKNMLSVINTYLDLSPREKLEFSLSSRLNSFMGQYGGITQDIYKLLMPYIVKGSIDTSIIPHEDLKRITRHIRSKLMP